MTVKKSSWKKIGLWLLNLARGSLLIQSIKVAVILSLFVVLIFRVIPQKTYFTANINTDEFVLPQGKIPKIDIDVNEIIYLSKVSEEIYAEADCIEINGKTYKRASNEDWIYIDFNTSRGRDSVRFLSDDDSNMNFYAAKWGSQGDSIQASVIEPEDWILIQKKNDKVTREEIDISIISNFAISSNKKLTIELANCNIFVSHLDGEHHSSFTDGDMGDSWSNIQFADQDVTIVFPNGVKNLAFSNIVRRNMKLISPYINTVELKNIKEFKLHHCNGDVSVYYNPESVNYEIMGQEIEFNSKDNSISATLSSMDNEQYNMNFIGYVDEIKLSSNSLMPSLMNYLKENAYISPTLLVTIIAGAISLIKLNDKKDGNAKSAVADKESRKHRIEVDTNTIDKKPNSKLLGNVLKKRTISKSKKNL